MEKVMTVMLTALMLLQAGSLQKMACTPNGLMVLRETAAQSELQVDGVVLEAWTPKAGEKAVQELAQALGAAEIASGGEASLEAGGTIKLLREEEAVTVQLILPDEADAERYYTLLSRWMQRHGQGRPAGATILAHYAEELSPEGCQALVCDLVSPLPAKLVSSMQEGPLLSSAYEIAGVAPSLEICGEKINMNVACVAKAGQTAVYLGSPVIYQQY